MEPHLNTVASAAHLSRIERGVRPPTQHVADACDRVFPERKGWFAEYYEGSKSWVPSSFRNWAEYEDNARSLSIWSPGIVHGLAQTGDYAREILAASHGVTDEIINARLDEAILVRDTKNRDSATLAFTADAALTVRFLVDERPVFGDQQTITGLTDRFDTLRAESMRASESLALVQEMADRWEHGARAATAGEHQRLR